MLNRKVFIFFSAVIVVTLLFGTLYAGIQQTLRQTANDPQIQRAEDTAQMLNNGKNPADTINADAPKVDVSTSLAPFEVIYDNNNHLVASSGTTSDIPALPPGLFSHVNASKHHLFTWQPTANLRFAAVLVKAKDYTVLSARSLREVENRESRIGQITLIGWLAAVCVLAGPYLLSRSVKQLKTAKR